MGTKTREEQNVRKRDLQVYRLKIYLSDIEPPLWRVLEVYGGISMGSLATAIQVAFGWSSEHMCQFKIKKLLIGDGSDWFVENPQKERQALKDRFQRLNELIRSGEPAESALATVEAEEQAKQDEGPLDDPALWEMVPHSKTKFSFLYDFGDCWEHDIQVEKISEAEPGILYPRCTEGARAHPIEDCGGAYAFLDMIKAVGKPKHNAYWRLEEWGLEKWDPEKFELDKINKELKRVFKLRERSSRNRSPSEAPAKDGDDRADES